MGAQHSCPPGFERSMFLTCAATCPGDFQKVRANGERCVHIRRSNRFFPLQAIPYNAPKDKPVPTEPKAFEAERTRVLRETTQVRKQVDDDIAQEQLVRDAADAKRPQVHEFSRIQSEYATYKDVSSSANEVRRIKDSLRVFRPPTAPSSDLEKERRAIADIAKQNMFFIQAVLMILLLALVGYIMLPIEWAHGIAFLLLCTAISIGFFLRR